MLEEYLSQLQEKAESYFRVSSCPAPLHQTGSHNLAWLEELSQT